ncbi:MAG TPA: Ig-like domain-containing protein, partial [Myxococcota bacterium]|nr:Ig-like domain-containing protein [Myxococcota bacterium]
MNRYLRPLAVTFAIIGTALVSFGGACNETTVRGDGEGDGSETGEGGNTGPSKHPSLGEGEVAASSKGGGPVEVKPGTFDYALREGTPDQGKTDAKPPVKANPLSPADTDKLLARLPPIQMGDGDVVDFALREGSKPPPLTGEQLQATFPPPVVPDVAQPDVAGVKAEVLRYQPEGDVPLAPRITITFSTPMVPLTSHDTLAKSAVPAKMTPDIEGNWRWVGTKTLFFDPVGRAPMATDFKVEVPAGVKDALGRAIEQGKSFSFRTPPPSLVTSLPQGDAVKLEPVFYALFDQKIDAKGALTKVKIQAGGKSFKAVELNDEEMKKELPGVAENKDITGRWVAFKLDGKLPKDTNVTVTFPKGFPSAEGPRMTEKDRSWSFKTYGPFKVQEARCGWRGECYPGQPFSIQFSNPIDEDLLEPKQVTVDPAVMGLEAEPSHNYLNLRGMTKGATTYTVKLDKGMKDIYGQTLEGETGFEWVVKSSRSLLMGNVKPLTVLDPVAKKKRLPVYVMNMPEVDVELYKVEPSDWMAFLKYNQERYRNDKPQTPPGKKVFGKRVATEAPKEELFELGVDLSPALDGDFGQLIAVVRPVGIDKTWERDRMTVVTWVQATKLGLDAFADGDQLVVWATSLDTGRPADGATIEFAGQTGQTDAHGIARFELPTGSGEGRVILAKKDGDLAFLTDTFYAYGGSSWVKRTRADDVRWLVFDDRHLYRPDETVSVKGALRLIESGSKGDVALLPAGSLTEMSWSATDSQGNEIGKGKVPVSVLGTFDLTLKLPKTPNLGSANIRFITGLGRPGSEYYHSFEIQEFRRPEFEVSSTVSEGPHIVGGSATVSVTASYFAGGPLPNTAVNWSVSTSPTNFTPPNQSDFIFGEWVPWWGYGGGENWNNNYQSFEGRTDGSGTHRLGLDFKSVEPARPTSV